MMTPEQQAFMQAVEAAIYARSCDFMRSRPGFHGRPGEVYAKLPMSIRSVLANLKPEDVADFTPLPWWVDEEHEAGRWARGRRERQTVYAFKGMPQ